MRKEIIIEIIVISYVVLFLYTGISKLIDYSVFKEQLATSAILAPISNLIAIILPYFEFSLVILLVIPRWRLKGLWGSLILMVLFTTYVIYILLFNTNIPCSCGGILEQMSWPQHIAFNSLFIVMSFVAIVLENRLNAKRRQNIIDLLNTAI